MIASSIATAAKVAAASRRRETGAESRTSRWPRSCAPSIAAATLREAKIASANGRLKLNSSALRYCSALDSVVIPNACLTLSG
jgi:hypothetical protein